MTIIKWKHNFFWRIYIYWFLLFKTWLVSSELENFWGVGKDDDDDDDDSKDDVSCFELFASFENSAIYWDAVSKICVRQSSIKLLNYEI